MDGPEGETHVEVGARIMGWLFGSQWADFSRYHSRFYARRDGVEPSRLCYADKLAFCFEWRWCYLLRANLTGEIKEYQAIAAQKEGKYAGLRLSVINQREWFNNLRLFMLRYVAVNYKI